MKGTTIALNTRKIMWVLCGIALLLLLAHILAMTMTYAYGRSFFYGLVPLFDFALEKNAPTYFSSFLLLLNGALLFVLWKSTTSAARPERIWLVLAIVFCFLSLDEFAGLHELMIKPIRDLSGASGAFFFAWIIPYGIAVLVLAMWVIPAIWKLGRNFFLLFTTAAFFYVGGAIGIEMLEGIYFEYAGVADRNYRMISSTQEVMEVVGLLILVHTLLALLIDRQGGFSVIVSGEDT